MAKDNENYFSINTEVFRLNPFTDYENFFSKIGSEMNSGNFHAAACSGFFSRFSLRDSLLKVKQINYFQGGQRP